MTYGCFNRPPLQETVYVQDGWYLQQLRGNKHLSRAPRMIEIPDPMTKSCQYQADDKYNDPQCIGCKHKESHDA